MVRKMHFIGVIHKDVDSDYGISFPDFPGCISAGSTLQEVIEMGREAVHGLVEIMDEEGETIPENPLTLDQVMKHAYADGLVTTCVIEVIPPSEKVDIRLSIPLVLLNRIDKFTDDRNTWFTETAIQHLDEIEKEKSRLELDDTFPERSRMISLED
ncbi:Type II toxin-antitoxin system HicB family antit oxin [Planctomycetales bacterium 10988]|nr:Type II toxin-antitoxin system HicB family antit oxin [Planctomycetales bacterium 10988]